MRRRMLWLFVPIIASMAMVWGLQAAPRMGEQTVESNSLIISEVAWSGTAAGVYYEWIELYNNSSETIPLNGWQLSDGGDITINLTGNLAGGQYHLLERFDDAVYDVGADQVYIGVLADGGETLTLIDDQQTVIDTANIQDSAWPAGDGSPNFHSMERRDPSMGDEPDNWVSNDGQTRNGLDVNGLPINGTPRQPNSMWSVEPVNTDLIVNKIGPSTSQSGDDIRYTLSFSNAGSITATGVILTDTLPKGLSYVQDDGGYPMSQPMPGVLVWQLGMLPGGMIQSIHLTTTISENLSGLVTNEALIGSNTDDSNPINNHDQLETTVVGPVETQIVIDALFYDGYEDYDYDEAVRLINFSEQTIDLSGWQIEDQENGVFFPANTTLDGRQGIWIAREAAAFYRQFGFLPDFEARSSRPDVPDLTGTWHGYNNDGDEVILRDDDGNIVDVLVYLAGDTSLPGWAGPSLEPYTVSGVFGPAGQLLYRMKDQQSGSVVSDTNTAADWAQSRTDPINGRKVQYPGWDLESFFHSIRITETAQITIGIAPDNAYDLLAEEFTAAQHSIHIETLSFTNLALASILADAAGRGVEVRLLLEGSPVGGIDDMERLACEKLEAENGQCYFMISDDSLEIYDRYRYLHAKFFIIDDIRVIISTENLSPNSLPNDEKDDGTWGRRGTLLSTNSASVVEQFKRIWSSDFDPDHHQDLFRWQAGDPIYGKPPPGTIAITVTGGTTYSVRFPEPATYQGVFSFEVIQSPENSLRDVDGLLSILNSAGPGDTILVEQLDERPHWGSSTSTPELDPNPRLQAFITAARRGATVRLLLDSYFVSEIGEHLNDQTCMQVNAIAFAEDLDLRCSLANPTGLGIHNKMVLANIKGQGYIFIGSINGTELSHKGNREVAILLQSDDAFEYLATLFDGDWPETILMPVIFRRFSHPADHILISEVLYDPSGLDDAEFIELVNPTAWPINIGNFTIGDALKKSDFEDVRRFPSGIIVHPQETIVIALTATGFNSNFGFNPDFEVIDSDPSVNNLEDDPNWGDPATILQLGNLGDEVLLRDPAGNLVDAIAYGKGYVPDHTTCPLAISSNYSLERYPFWQDTDQCDYDFRAWPLPGPGSLP